MIVSLTLSLVSLALGVAMAVVLHSWVTRERLEPEGSLVRESKAWAPPENLFGASLTEAGKNSVCPMRAEPPPEGYCSVRYDHSGNLVKTDSDGSTWVMDEESKQWLAEMSQALKTTGYLA